MKINKIFWTIAFITFISFAKAQDKYDFAIIELRTFLKEISISLNGKEFIVEKVDYLNQPKEIANANPFLNKVLEYQDKGWEVISFNSIAGGNSTSTYTAYLRKKQGDKK